MTQRQALFTGLIIDEYDQPVEAGHVGDEAMYIVNDGGFRRHIPAESIDRPVLKTMLSSIEGHEDVVAQQAANMLGQDDPFSKAMIENQLKHIDEQIEAVLQAGLPEEWRAYMGMSGLRIRIDVHGEILEINQPGAVDDEGE